MKKLLLILLVLGCNDGGGRVDDAGVDGGPCEGSAGIIWEQCVNGHYRAWERMPDCEHIEHDYWCAVQCDSDGLRCEQY